MTRAHPSWSTPTPSPRPTTIPFGCLVPRDLDNVLVAGRCVSSTHEGNGSVRITGTCFATGEAAGVAAATLDVARLQDQVRRRGVLGARAQS